MEDLAVVFCGINPGLKAAATGHHFQGNNNRFWKTLHLAGFTSELLRPEHGRELLTHRCGLTTAVSRVTIRTKTDTHSHQVTCSSRIQNRQSFASPPPRRDLLSLGRRQSEYPSGPLLPLSIQYLQLIEAL